MDIMNYYSRSEQIQNLKEILETPKLYMSNNFEDLRNQIDIYCTQNDLNSNESKKSWLNIINKINENETNCLNKISNKSFSEIINEIEKIKTNLLDQNEPNFLIDRLEYQIKSALFQNKSILFLIRTNLDITNNTALNCPILLIISNYYISNEIIKLIKCQTNVSNLTNDYLIANEITSKINNVKNDVIEIELFNQKVLILPHKFSSVEQDAFSNQILLESLTISIQTITNKTFKNLNNLKQLCLFDCNLTQLDETIFKNLINLEELILDSNQISIVYDNAFKRLKKLKILNLANNSIRTLKLNGLNRLENFNMRNNKIHLVNFKEMKNLLSLSLESNMLNKFDLIDFKNVANLNTLELGYNFLSVINDITFSNLNNLVKLDLSHNKLSFINKTAFKNMINLGELYLQYNKLIIIDELFNGLTKLRVLNLSNNQIESIDNLGDLPSLKQVYLNDNNLRCLRDETIERLCELSELFLFNNKINVNDLNRTKLGILIRNRKSTIKI